MERLPDEIVDHVFWQADLEDIPNLRLVSRAFAAHAERHMKLCLSIDVAAGDLTPRSALVRERGRASARILKVVAVRKANAARQPEAERPYAWWYGGGDGDGDGEGDGDRSSDGGDPLVVRGTATREQRQALLGLIAVLSRLSGLEHITFSGDPTRPPTACFERGRLARDMEYRRGHRWRAQRLDPGARHESMFAADSLALLLRALWAAGARPRSLWVQWASWRFFKRADAELALLLSPLRHLRALHLCLLNDDFPHDRWGRDLRTAGWDAIDCRKEMEQHGRLARCLARMRDLRALHLTFSYGHGDSPGLWPHRCRLEAIIPDGLTWAHLRSLRVDSVKAAAAALAGILARHAATLRELHLGDVNLVDGSWVALLTAARARLALADAGFGGVLQGVWRAWGHHGEHAEGQCWDLNERPDLGGALRRYFLLPRERFPLGRRNCQGFVAFNGRRWEGGRLRRLSIHRVPHKLALCCDVLGAQAALQRDRVRRVCGNKLAGEGREDVE